MLQNKKEMNVNQTCKTFYLYNIFSALISVEVWRQNYWFMGIIQDANLHDYIYIPLDLQEEGMYQVSELTENPQQDSHPKKRRDCYLCNTKSGRL